jgi:uncharacterized membrane protein
MVLKIKQINILPLLVIFIIYSLLGLGTYSSKKYPNMHLKIIVHTLRYAQKN